MPEFFAAAGRFAVRFRWVIVVAWVAAAVLANSYLPSLTSVARQSNTSSLPASRAACRLGLLAGSELVLLCLATLVRDGR